MLAAVKPRKSVTALQTSMSKDANSHVHRKTLGFGQLEGEDRDQDVDGVGVGCVHLGKENAQTEVAVSVDGQRQEKQRQQSSAGGSGKQQVAMLRRDMQSLDDEIAQLEASMQAAAAKLR